MNPGFMSMGVARSVLTMLSAAGAPCVTSFVNELILSYLSPGMSWSLFELSESARRACDVPS